MELKDIYDLMDRFESSALSELQLELSGTKVSMKKGTEEAAPVLVKEERKLQNQKSIPAVETSAEQVEKKCIQAPIVGTFYRAASPEAEPFVKEGQKVKKGDVIGIIEAMKMMNEVTAQEEGIVDSILVEDGTLVAFHQTLMELV